MLDWLLGSDEHLLWQDNDIRFGLSGKDLKLRKGEFTVFFLEGVEDSRATRPTKGLLIVTNLRSMWMDEKDTFNCLSIGHGTIVKVENKSTMSKVRGAEYPSLHIHTQHSGFTATFIFTYLEHTEIPMQFANFPDLRRHYEMTRLYRETRLRVAIITNKQLRLLERERVYSRVEGIWSVAASSGNLGVFFTSSHRIVWFAQMAENFTASIPYCQLVDIKLKKTMYGYSLLIHCYSGKQGQVPVQDRPVILLAFRVDDHDLADRLLKEIKALKSAYLNNMDFGLVPKFLDADLVDDKANVEDSDPFHVIDNEEQEDHLAGMDSVLAAAYLKERFALDDPAGEGENEIRMEDRIDFSDLLGIAVEQPLPGVKLESLWSSN